MTSTWDVHKFGGTSLADAGRYHAVGRILLSLRRPGARVAAVVSAMSGVTDALLEAVDSAARRDDAYLLKIQALRRRHLETAGRLGLDASQQESLNEVINSDTRDIEEVLRGVWIARLSSEQIREFVSGYGEIWSAQFLRAHLAAAGAQADWLDARRVLVVEPGARGVALDWALSRERLGGWRRDERGAEFVVVTGYVASTREGVATTLRRNGSDLSASLGGAFLDQLGRRLERLRAERGIDLRVRAVMNSRRLLLGERGVSLEGWRDALASSGAGADLERFVEHVRAEHLPHAVVVDATASDELPARYGAWLARGLNIITPNKKANSGPLARYRHLREAARRHGRHFLYETNVGAGLPVIHTLRDLIETGDEVRRVEGVLSGTLSFIFNSLDGARPFSEVVRDARARGFTEPDPREDLSGTDVARKLIILARELGLGVELEDVSVESLVPEELRGASAEEFLSGLGRHDRAMSERLASARARGQALRYVGRIDEDGRLSAGLRPFPADHPFANLRGSDNVISFRTARYDAQPMIVRGPGAGPEVTAAGVFSDLLRLASFLGAPQ